MLGQNLEQETQQRSLANNSQSSPILIKNPVTYQFYLFKQEEFSKPAVENSRKSQEHPMQTYLRKTTEREKSRAVGSPPNVRVKYNPYQV